MFFYSKKYNYRTLVLDTSFDSLRVVNGSIDSSTDITFKIVSTKTVFQLSSIQSIYIRQASIPIDGHYGINSNSGKASNINARYANYLMAYENTIRWLILNCFSKVNIIGFDSGGFINKLEVLKHAAEIGLTIPETIVTTLKKDLIKFKRNHKSIIVKSLGLGLAFNDLKAKKSYQQFTSEILDEDLKLIPDSFNLSMIQKRIDKKFEVRTFYLDGRSYSWALLSQNNSKTKVDYRKYDWSNPMRVVAFKLPKHVENSLKTLMEKLELRSGSIDFMYSTDGQYFFLEVNPAGQFGYNSQCSNYNLELEIANSLINKNEQKKHRTFHS